MPKFNQDGSYVAPNYTDEQAYKKGKRWLIGILIFLFIVLPLGGVAFKWVTAPARGAIAAREQIQTNPNYRIAKYDEFFQLCSAVQAQEDRVAIFRSDTSPAGQTNLRAVQASRAALIREYNAKAAGTYTAGQFRSSKLPFHLDPNNLETKCTTAD